MPIVRLNAVGSGIDPHTPKDLNAISRPARDSGPVIVMLHGYKYLPGHPEFCPHRRIFALHPNTTCRKMQSWPRQLGFGAGHGDEGLGLAFGWNARGALWTAQASARSAGLALADAITLYHRANPGRKVHVIAHSMGTEVALEALALVPAGSIGRIVSLTGACYHDRTLAALDTPAGRHTEFFNIVSRENDTYDFLFERLITPPRQGDRSIGQGLSAANAVTIQIDCPATLDYLDRIGSPIGGPERRICHWSSYTRPGILRFYNVLLRQPKALPIDLLRLGMPRRPAPRWSRLIPRPTLPSRVTPIQTQAS